MSNTVPAGDCWEVWGYCKKEGCQQRWVHRPVGPGFKLSDFKCPSCRRRLYHRRFRPTLAIAIAITDGAAPPEPAQRHGPIVASSVAELGAAILGLPAGWREVELREVRIEGARGKVKRYPLTHGAYRPEPRARRARATTN